MPQVYFTKVGQYAAIINSEHTNIWHVKSEDGTAYYVLSKHVHSTLTPGRYWTDQRHLIEMNRIQQEGQKNMRNESII